jgi:glycine reductase
MAREFERSGLPTAYVTTLTTLASMVGVHRIIPGIRIPHPLGDPSLSPEQEAAARKQLVRTALDATCRPLDERAAKQPTTVTA